MNNPLHLLSKVSITILFTKYLNISLLYLLIFENVIISIKYNMIYKNIIYSQKPEASDCDEYDKH